MPQPQLAAGGRDSGALCVPRDGRRDDHVPRALLQGGYGGTTVGWEVKCVDSDVWTVMFL